MGKQKKNSTIEKRNQFRHEQGDNIDCEQLRYLIVTTVRYPNGDRYEGQVLRGEGVTPSSSGSASSAKSTQRDKHRGRKQKSDALQKVKEGVGCYYWRGGDKYCGEWENGQMHGEGCFHWACGDVYTGSWKRGQMCGAGTKQCASDGSVRRGQWRGGLLHGLGECVYGCGDAYAGGHVEGRREGRGRYVWNTSSVSTGGVDGVSVLLIHCAGDAYVGDWREDCMHGYGEFSRSSLGSTRNAEHKKHLGRRIAGVGNWTVRSEYFETYSGEFRGGVPHGVGRALFRSGGSNDCFGEDSSGGEKETLLVEYFGEWKFGRRHGHGECKYHLHNGEEDFLSCGMLYCGGFEDGKREGQGMLTHVQVSPNSSYGGDEQVSGVWGATQAGATTPILDGGPPVEPVEEGEAAEVEEVRELMYQGQWHHNARHGYGIQVDELGGVYRGEFSEGLRHGRGVYSRCVVRLPITMPGRTGEDGSSLQAQLLPLLQMTAVHSGPDSEVVTTIKGRWECGVLAEELDE